MALLSVDVPILIPVDDVFSIVGRGPRATVRNERGVIKPGDEHEIVGLEPSKRRTRGSVALRACEWPRVAKVRRLRDQGVELLSSGRTAPLGGDHLSVPKWLGSRDRMLSASSYLKSALN